MVQSSKEKIQERLHDLSLSLSLDNVESFQATNIAEELHISRSMASSYLNALFAEGQLVKVASRPVLFFDRGALEHKFGMVFGGTSFLSMAELHEYIAARQHERYNFQDVIGAGGSLKEAIEQAKAAACYPPHGLPYLLAGADEGGKAELRDAICRWCVSEGVVRGKEAVRVIDAAALVESSTAKRVLDALTADASIDLLWVANCHALADEDWPCLFGSTRGERLAVTANTRANTDATAQKAGTAYGMRLFFDCTGEPADAIPVSWIGYIPLIANYPSFSSRSMDEREACVYQAFRSESANIGRRVLVSTNVVKRLVNLDDMSGMDGLRRIVQMTCASAMAEGVRKQNAAELKVFGSHVPANPGIPPLSFDTLEEDPVLVDAASFDPLQRGADVLDALNRFLEALSALPSARAPEQGDETRVFQCLSRYFDLITDRRRGQARDLSDQTISKLIDRVFERYGMNEPVGFVRHLTSAMTFFRENNLAVAANRTRLGSRIGDATHAVEMHYAAEAAMVRNLSSTLRDCWGSSVSEENLLVLAFYLHWCTRGQRVPCAGVIVAHGYSTATSIAASVNAMLHQHVFDALDMPLDVSMEEVECELSRFVDKMPLQQDLLIMVDMGSLEAIADRLNLSLQVNVGVIDNVSTATALEAGSLMLQGRAVSDILPLVQEAAACRYSFHRNERVRRVILFVSENGIGAASRLAELFFSSLPTNVDLEAVPCDFLTVADEVYDGMYQDRSVLFVLGTSDPGIKGVNFMLLENVIDMSEDDPIDVDLSAYLAPADICTLRENLIKSFTLENLMRHLTILEPDRLMDVVSGSIDRLQKNLGTHFSYRMLMRLYVHIGYLVERLVTRRYVSDESSSDFADKHADFVERPRASFRGITAAYGVDLPISEIHYVYTLITTDMPSGGGASGDDFFK